MCRTTRAITASCSPARAIFPEGTIIVRQAKDAAFGYASRVIIPSKLFRLSRLCLTKSNRCERRYAISSARLMLWFIA